MASRPLFRRGLYARSAPAVHRDVEPDRYAALQSHRTRAMWPGLIMVLGALLWTFYAVIGATQSAG